MQNDDMMCLCMMQHDMTRDMAWQQWQMSCLSTTPLDAYKRLQLHDNFQTTSSKGFNLSCNKFVPDFSPLPVYYSVNNIERISITREAYSIDGSLQMRLTLKEISKHNFVLHCCVAAPATQDLKDKIYFQLDDIFKHIFDDTEYIVAYIEGNLPLIDEILKNYDFKKITEHGDNDTYLLK